MQPIRVQLWVGGPNVWPPFCDGRHGGAIHKSHETLSGDRCSTGTWYLRLLKAHSHLRTTGANRTELVVIVLRHANCLLQRVTACFKVVYIASFVGRHQDKTPWGMSGTKCFFSALWLLHFYFNQQSAADFVGLVNIDLCVMSVKGQTPLRYRANEPTRELVCELVCDLLASS